MREDGSNRLPMKGIIFFALEEASQKRVCAMRCNHFQKYEPSPVFDLLRFLYVLTVDQLARLRLR